ncbi:MAG: ribonuclease [Rhodocyclaceae bacterium]|nr:ribonuclease [Rhodocyclaceae bacterium]
MARLARPVLLLVACLALLAGCAPEATDSGAVHASGAPARAYPGLPAEAVDTLALIRRGGPFPYRKDGTTFQNREGHLPRKPRGYYREYTVPTPGERTRGARRIVTGGHPPEVFYYTEDHYRSFRRIEEQP